MKSTLRSFRHDRCDFAFKAQLITNYILSDLRINLWSEKKRDVSVVTVFSSVLANEEGEQSSSPRRSFVFSLQAFGLGFNKSATK